VRIFLDTNVLVSAFATRGLCADLFRHVVSEHELIVGEVVLDELRRILLRRFKVPAETVKSIEILLRDHTVVPRPERTLSLGLRDSDDEWVVASAVAASADIIVTGDGDILTAKKLPVRAVNPRGLWELLRTSGPKT
jgi:putative PIN family toxin of toxin-antitoxin system